MNLHNKCLTALSALLFAGISIAQAQSNYQYSLNLNDVKDDKLSVTLNTPKVSESEITFYMPKIVPGTYRNSDFGKFVSNLKAYNAKGQPLAVKQTSENSWEIKQANTLSKIVYDVEDTWDSKIKHEVYSMAGTNFEANKNFVLNTCGIFGYLEHKKDLPFTLNITKPAGFYGSTGLVPSRTSNTEDVYETRNADHLYDSPIMFCMPDTTTIKVGNASVLISVYSPNKLATSAVIAKNLETLLQATNKHLGGKLPVDKYAFIYYFNGEQAPFATSGAWEHSYSSFYSLKEEPQEKAIGNWVDISSHEFFHIVTPLTISSKEVKEFDFNKPVMSRHLWLYEGSTEYDSHLVQVRAGINTPNEFLQKLAQQLSYSKNYFKDNLRFTELSQESAGKWQDQYSNVYLKGALISASLDLYLLKLSGGNYSLKNLKHDLGIKYGKDKYFNDDELFDVITSLTFPEVKQFFADYVEGDKSIPYETFFGYAGVDIVPPVADDKSKSSKLVLNPNANAEQIAIRNAWLNTNFAAPATNTAAAADVSTIDQLVNALYGVISGPAGERDWKRFESLFYPGAYMGAIRQTAQGTTLNKISPADYVRSNRETFKKYAFTEKELGRTVNEFGNLAQVFSSYVYQIDMEKPASKRGINNIQLIKQDNRWWIISLLWNEEKEGLPIPAKYINQNAKK